MPTIFNNSDYMSNFDWLDYDESPIFKHGIAIVRRNGKFGAVMVGGKEIVPPIYDDLSEFKNGYAVAKWNNEERIINLSGQIRVLKGNKEIFLPEEYDWGFDFIEDICVVVKNDKYGIIDFNFNVNLDCVYDSFINYHNGYAIFSKCRWSEWSDDVWSDDFLIDNKGKVKYKIKKSFTDGHKIVCLVDDQQKQYGVMDSNMQIIIPVTYSQINRLKNGLYVTDSQNDIKLFMHPSKGNIISEKVADYVIDLNKNFFCTFRKDNIQNISETCIYTSPESLQLCIPSEIYAESDDKENIIFQYRNLKYRYDLDGDLYIIEKKIYYGSESYMYRWDKIIERKVKYDYLKYNHKPFSEKYEIIEDNQKKKGLSDLEGNTVISPQYMEIYPFTEEMFIVSVLVNGNTSQKFGIVDILNNIKIPFTFNYLIPINDKYLAYTDNELNIRENYKLTLPSTFTYTDIRFGITDIRGNKITKSIFSQIALNIDNTVFIIREDSGFGLIDCKGQYILNSKYNSITYNEQNGTFTTSIQYSESGNYPFEIRTNNVSLDGYYIVKNHIGELVKVPSQIVDWCGDFSENEIASVIKHGYLGYINVFNLFVSYINDTKMIMPSKYDFIRDFTYGYAPVLLNGKFGIVNDVFEIIIPCEYEYIEPLSDCIFKFKLGNKWGVIDILKNLISEADYVNIVYETAFLLKVVSNEPNGDYSKFRYGLLDLQGNIIVSNQCENIIKFEDGSNVFLIVELDGKQGVYDKYGTLVIPFIYSKISVNNNYFYCWNYVYGDVSAIYNFKGEHLLYVNDKQYVIVPSEYEYAQYLGYRLVSVSKNYRWGLIDLSGQVIVENKFMSIDEFDGSFAKVVQCVDEKKYQCGLIDTNGDIVLPIEYEEIEKWDNGYFVVKKNGLYGLFSPALHMLIKPSIEYLKKIDDKYILAIINSAYALIDYFGNEIISTNKYYGSFSEIEVLENGFFKVIYYKSQYNNNSRIGISNNKGKIIYYNGACDDITYIGDGLLIIKSFVYTTHNGIGHSVYNIANIQGKELFRTYYDHIEILGNGNFLICKNGYYGMATNTGQIFVQPKYTNKIEFENDFANIETKGSLQKHKIDSKGYVILIDSNKNEIKIPKDYYWGTDFICGISIVRSKDNDKLGLINEQYDVIIEPKFDAIDFLENKTILVRKDYFYGLYDINGKCILPVVFTLIEYINKNSIRVIWNLNFIKNWKPGDDTCEVDTNKFVSNEVEYRVNNRSALCNTKGHIINDKCFIYVETFENVYGYARAYCTTYIDENHRLKREQVGIIDINGKTIVDPEYDGIILYGSYARLRKGSIYGIADLQNKQIKIFKEINIKKTREIDSFGRFIYIDGDCNNLAMNKGVIGPNGIIISSGKFAHIELLKNGLIKVSNEGHCLFGLLGLNGNELLKMEYSYISSFNYGYASVCIGGHKNEEFPYRHIGGKWGIIDKTGKFIVECIYNEEQVLSAEDIIKHNLLDVSEFDSQGRILFTKWESPSNSIVGVIGLNGIIVPIGKYPNVDLLDNGLIMISDEKKQLFGLLGLDGKELLEMKYSYISSFKNGYASICIGGHNKGYFIDKQHVGGKWGVIDQTGKIVVECIHDEDLSLIKEDNSVIDLSDETNVPKILCSDFISNEESSDNYYHSYDNDYGYDEDDTSSIYDNPYYNDNLDMDQQSIEFWNSL